MKKLLIAGNCLFFCIAVVLGVLYVSQTREPPERVVEIVEVIRTVEVTPAPTQAPPTPTPEPEPEPWMIEESFYLPFGGLPLPMLQQYAGYDAARPWHSLREQNPIDTTFMPYWSACPFTQEKNALAGHYAKSWMEEALHALDLFAQHANPADAYMPDIIQDAKAGVLGFALITGELYATVFRTDVFLYEGTTPGDTVSIRESFPGAMTASGAAVLRSYTFYLYDLLASMNVQPDFVFDAQPIHEQWDYLLE